MASFKLVISDPKSKKAMQKEVEQGPSGLVDKRIGDKFSGDIAGLPGYELEITGGSDRDGFPMRRDVEGSNRKKVLLSMPPGFHPEKKGLRKRKSVRGNTISTQITQVNAKVIKQGPKSFAELTGKPAEKPKEAVKEEAEKAEEKPKEAKAEEKPKEAVKAEKPEAKKEEAKAEPAKAEKAAEGSDKKEKK